MIGKTISHFEVLDRIGKGGMGVVYKARDMELDRFVAIKFLAEEIVGDTDSVERFTREAKAASSLDHPNICTIHEIGRTTDGQLFIVMGLYDGDTLRERIDADLNLDDAIRFGTQIARGLAAAHERGIVHRDIKPGNVVLTDKDRAVIVDFGLATLPGVIALTKTGSTVGTAAYMAPEQLKGSEADNRSDLWSLGVMFYEMVNGRRPFEGAYEQAISYAIVNQDPQPGNTEGDPRLVQLQDIISRCLEKEPDNRYQAAQDLVDDLEALSSPKATQVGESPTSTPAKSPSRRTLGLVGALTLAAALILILIYSRSDIHPTDRSSEQAVDARPVLLILPFENLGDADDAFFATGVSDEITGRLSSLGGLSVISRRSAREYAETDKSTTQIGNELGVDYILEGQVRWARHSDGESQVRISPALIRVSDDTELWSESYDRGIDDIFSIQADVATRVAAELDERLSQSDRDLLAEAPTADLAAYESFLRGKALFWESEFEPAVEALESALAADPSFVQAAYLLARTYSLWHFGDQTGRTAEIKPKAVRATARVDSLAPGSPEAYLASGFLYYYVERDFGRALEQFDVAIAARPGDADAVASRAFILRRFGRMTEAAEELDRVVRLDPTHVPFLTEAARTNRYLRRFAKADELYSRAMALDPLNPGISCEISQNLLAWKGATEEVVRRWESLPPDPATVLMCGIYGVDMAQRNYDKILSDLDAIAGDESFTARLLGSGIRALVSRYTGNKEIEQASWQNMMALLEGLGPTTTNSFVIASLAIAKAGLGDRNASEAYLRRLDEVTANDAMARLMMVGARAQIYTIAGNKKEAINVIRADLESEVGAITGHDLQMPHWDPLRDEPAFQALVEKFGAPSRTQ